MTAVATFSPSQAVRRVQSGSQRSPQPASGTRRRRPARPTYSLYADLHWDPAALAEALADAKLFVFCNPSNPTGIVHRRDELESSPK